MWVVDKSLPRPNGHQMSPGWLLELPRGISMCLAVVPLPDLTWAKLGNVICRENMGKLILFQVDEIWWSCGFPNCDSICPTGGYWISKICLQTLRYHGQGPFAGMSWNHQAAKRFLVAVGVGIACRVAGHRSLSGQLATEGESMMMYQYDLLMDRLGRSEMVLETEQAT